MKNYLIEDNKPIAEINIIPFVDIILVILIIFMLTTPFILNIDLPDINLPHTQSAKKMRDMKVNIVLQLNGLISLNGEVLKLDQLSNKLKKIPDISPETSIVISADQNILHGKVISVIGAIQSSGYRKITIATAVQ